MENVASQSGTTINSQSIKSLHIDMNVVDELSSMEDNIIDKGTIIYLYSYLQIDLSIPWKTWTVPDPREIFGLQAPLTLVFPRPPPAAHQAKEGIISRKA